MGEWAANCEVVWMKARHKSSNLPWAVFPAQQLLWRAQPASTFVPSVSTSPRRRTTSPGSRRWSQHSHHLSLCSREMFPQSRPHWMLCSLQRWREEGNVLGWSWQKKNTSGMRQYGGFMCLPTARPGSEFMVWTISMPCQHKKEWRHFIYIVMWLLRYIVFVILTYHSCYAKWRGDHILLSMSEYTYFVWNINETH